MAARNEYLNGFRKRKDERRKKAMDLVKAEERKTALENRKERRAYLRSIDEQYE